MTKLKDKQTEHHRISNHSRRITDKSWITALGVAVHNHRSEQEASCSRWCCWCSTAAPINWRGTCKRCMGTVPARTSMLTTVTCVVKHFHGRSACVSMPSASTNSYYHHHPWPHLTTQFNFDRSMTTGLSYVSLCSCVRGRTASMWSLPRWLHYCRSAVQSPVSRVMLRRTVMAWLSVWSEVQMICIWSSWCHCYPIIFCSSKIQNSLPFWCQLTQVVLEKRLLNGCSSSSSSSSNSSSSSSKVLLATYLC